MKNPFEGRNYTTADVEKIEESGGNFHGNIPEKTEEENSNIEKLKHMIEDTKNAIKEIKEPFLQNNEEVSPGVLDFIKHFENKIKYYSNKIEELESKNVDEKEKPKDVA